MTAGIATACGTERINRSVSMTIDKQKLQGRQALVAGLLLARPTQPTAAAPRGLQPLGLDAKRDGLLYVPPTYQVKQPAPLVVMLHALVVMHAVA